MPNDHGGARASPRTGAARPLFAGYRWSGGHARSTANSGRPSKATWAAPAPGGGPRSPGPVAVPPTFRTRLSLFRWAMSNHYTVPRCDVPFQHTAFW